MELETKLLSSEGSLSPIRKQNSSHEEELSVHTTIIKENYIENKKSTRSTQNKNSHNSSEEETIITPKKPRVSFHKPRQSHSPKQKQEQLSPQLLQNQIQSSEKTRKLLLKPFQISQKIHIFENIGENNIFKCIVLPEQQLPSQENEEHEKHFFNSVKHEYLVSQNISHPNLIKYTQFHEEIYIYGRKYSAIEGQLYSASIEEEIYINNKIHSLNTIKSWLQQLLECLALLQKRGISHNLLHPSNLLLDKRREKVVISNLKYANRQNSQTVQDTLSKWSSPYSFKYVGPEVLQLLSGQIGNFCEIKNDVYTLGIIFFEIIFGCIPEKPTLVSISNPNHNSFLYNLFAAKQNEQQYQWDYMQLYNWIEQQAQRKFQQNIQTQKKNQNDDKSDQNIIKLNYKQNIDMKQQDEEWSETEKQNMAQFFLQCICLNPSQRLSAQELLNHQWFNIKG